MTHEDKPSVSMTIEDGQINTLTTGQAFIAYSINNDLVQITSSFGDLNVEQNDGPLFITNENERLISRPLTEDDRKYFNNQMLENHAKMMEMHQNVDKMFEATNSNKIAMEKTLLDFERQASLFRNNFFNGMNMFR